MKNISMIMLAPHITDTIMGANTPYALNEASDCLKIVAGKLITVLAPDPMLLPTLPDTPIMIFPMAINGTSIIHRIICKRRLDIDPFHCGN